MAPPRRKPPSAIRRRKARPDWAARWWSTPITRAGDCSCNSPSRTKRCSRSPGRRAPPIGASPAPGRNRSAPKISANIMPAGTPPFPPQKNQISESHAMSNSPPLWKASVAVPKERTADTASLLELSPPAPQAVLIVQDPFLADAIVEALYEALPDAAFLTRLTGHPVTVAPLPDQDWIRHSQEGLPPVRAGRFFVYGAHDAGEVPPGLLAIRIEAGLAFGTGHHETTALCLVALWQLAKMRRFSRVLDLGC